MSKAFEQLSEGAIGKSACRTESDKQRLLFQKEGRGRGDGANYVPGRTLRDLRGIGRLHRFACARCGGRQIVLPSDSMLSVFLDEHWDPATCDIKEYCPQLDVEETMRIARSLAVRHPTLRDGSPAMLITDLLVCRVVGGDFQWTAIDISSSRGARSTALSAARQIKAEQWRRSGVRYRVAYSSGLNSHRAIHLWHLYNIAERVLISGLTDIERHTQRVVMERFRSGTDTTLLEVCHGAAGAQHLQRADCIAAMRRLIAMRMIECSLDVPVLLAQPRRDARITVAAGFGSEACPGSPRGRSDISLRRWVESFCKRG